MTRRQYQDIQRYVNKIAPLLGIGHWRLEVVEDQPDNQDWLACCVSYDGQTRAELAFRHDFIDCDPRDQVGTILHELLHVVYAQPQTLIRTQPDETLNLCWKNAQEYATDALARGLAPLFPLVEWR